MQSMPTESTIEIDQVTYPLESLDEYGFLTRIDLPSGIRPKALLRLGDEKLPVVFRVRENSHGLAKCSFANLSIAGSESIKRHLQRQRRGVVEGSLESRSYDELAQGVPQSQPTVSEGGSKSSSNQQESEASSRAAPAKGGVRSLAVLLMLFTMVGLCVLGVVLLSSRSQLSIENSALVGNYLPVNVKAEGEIVEVWASEGDVVKEGDLLMKLKNPAMQIERDQYAAQLATSRTKVKALQSQLVNTQQTANLAVDTRIEQARKKLAHDLAVAESEVVSSERFLAIARQNYERMVDLQNKGIVTHFELEAEQQELLIAEANKNTVENLVKQIKFSQANVETDTLLIVSERFDDEIARLFAELKIAKAQQLEFQSKLEIANEQFEHLNIVAPRDGTVYVVYRQLGEFVKVADETFGLSFEGRVWAAGQVSAGQSRRVRPGQPVTVSAPSLGKKFEGIVSAVGHRAMYSQGQYTADFRGGSATDVPVKVIIPELPESVPSGIRLEMAINTGFGISWLDQATGYALKSTTIRTPNIENQLDQGSIRLQAKQHAIPATKINR